MMPVNPSENWRLQWQILNERYTNLHERYLERERELSKAYDLVREKDGLHARTVEQLKYLN